MSKFEIGIARQDITPPLGTQLFGYPIDRPGNEVDDRLAATALVMRSDSTLAAIVSVDVGALDEDDVAAIRADIAGNTGIPMGNVTICATHTHSAPWTVQCWGWAEKNLPYLEMLRDRVVAAVVEAKSSLRPARAGVGVIKTDIGINRREVMPDGDVILGFNEWGPRDTDMTVIRFEGEAGPLAQIVHVGAHPTSRGGHPAVSRDWPGVMTDRLETVTGVPVLFINGAFGDVAPRTTIGGATGDGKIAAEEVGLRAANDAVQAWKTIKEFRAPDLRILTQNLELPLAPLPPMEEVEQNLEIYAGKEKARAKDGCECNYWNAVKAAHAGEPQTQRTFVQSITQIGPIAIVPFAGEVFSEIVLRVKKASPFAHTLCAGTTNGSHGYYVTKEARGRGGYEVWVGRAYGARQLGEDIDDALVEQNLKLLMQLSSKS